MDIITEYRDTKAAADAAYTRIRKAVRRVFAEYAKQKGVVSTRPYKPWHKWGVESFKFKGTKVVINRVYYGQYGYVENQITSLPSELVKLADAGDMHSVRGVIEDLIRVEGEDIEKRAAQRRKLAQENALMSAREGWDDMQAKYNGVRP